MKRCVSLLIAMVATTSINVHGEANMSPALTTATEKVIVFKDGYCLFVKQATGKVDAGGRTYLNDIPKAMVLGSFWVVPKAGKLTSVVARQAGFSRQGRQEIEKCLLLQFDPKSVTGKAEATLSYFGPGVRWIPTYRIALNNDGTADLLMQAELLNEAEDLADVPMDLVVGVPNFRFKDVVSPMSLEATLQNTLQQAAPQLMNQSMGNAMFSQRAGEFRGRSRGEESAPAAAGAPALPPELSGEGAQDLFVYHLPGITLRAGERAITPLLTGKVPARHLYTWDVRLSRAGTETVPGGGKASSPIKLLKNEVWHQIELANKSDVPWTTGAGLVMDGSLPICQELLTYTPIGGKCQVPLTVAIDVRGTYTEEETGRELKAVKFDGYDYVQIAKKGTLRMTNFKKQPIPLLVTCEFGGNATKASADGKITLTDFQNEDWTNFRGHPALVGHSTIFWDLQLGAGETKEVTCEYSYYVR